MSEIRIDFKVSKQEGNLVLGALELYARNTNNAATRNTVVNIIKAVEYDLTIDQIIFGRLATRLANVTNAKVKRSSDLVSQLGLKIGYRKTVLPRICNQIAAQLTKKHKPGKRHKRITSPLVFKASKVTDLIKLIKASYEAAK